MEEFIKEFYKKLTQKYNRVTVLVRRLKKEYVIYRIHALARQVIKEYPDCQRNKFSRHKPYKEL